jgi:hypothetical protein
VPVVTEEGSRIRSPNTTKNQLFRIADITFPFSGLNIFTGLASQYSCVRCQKKEAYKISRQKPVLVRHDKTQLRIVVYVTVAFDRDPDPNLTFHCDADPHPIFYFDADLSFYFVPDKAFHFDADPDPAFHFVAYPDSQNVYRYPRFWNKVA